MEKQTHIVILLSRRRGQITGAPGIPGGGRGATMLVRWAGVGPLVRREIFVGPLVGMARRGASRLGCAVRGEATRGLPVCT